MVEIGKKRNVAVVAHHGAGKTSLVEAILYMTGKLDRMGKTNDGNTFSDFTDEERERKVSIHGAVIHLEHDKHAINLLDLPGYSDFVGEVKSGMHAADAALFVINATSPVEVETERAWAYAEEYGLPRMMVVNQLDKERTNFATAVKALQDAFGKVCVPIQVPIGVEADFNGVVDLITMKGYSFEKNGKMKAGAEIPADAQELVEQYREMMLDCAAEVDEEVMEKYLAGEELSQEELIGGLRKAVANQSCVPILCAAAVNAVGTEPVLKSIINFMPAPDVKKEISGTLQDQGDQKVTIKIDPDGEFAAQVFKTRIDHHSGRISIMRVWSGRLTSDHPVVNTSTGEVVKIHHLVQVNGKEQNNVPEATAGDIVAITKHDDISTNHTLASAAKPIVIPPVEFPPQLMIKAISPINKGDEEKMNIQINRMISEDPTLRVDRDAETGETVMYGMGEQHLDLVVFNLKHFSKIEVELTTPKVAYRETITGHGEGSHRHKKQSGGRGQFGEVHFRLDPKPTGEGFEFVNAVVGGVVPTRFIPAVEKGVREALDKGILAGYPVVDVRVELFDGKDHPVDSSEAAFKMAGAMCFRKVAQQSKPILLEPIMAVDIYVPEEYLGDTMSDISGRRGRVLGMEAEGSVQHLRANVPLAEMFSYYVELRGITRGRGTYCMEFDHYDQVPSEITHKIIEGAQLEELDE